MEQLPRSKIGGYVLYTAEQVDLLRWSRHNADRNYNKSDNIINIRQSGDRFYYKVLAVENDY